MFNGRRFSNPHDLRVFATKNGTCRACSAACPVHLMRWMHHPRKKWREPNKKGTITAANILNESKSTKWENGGSYWIKVQSVIIISFLEKRHSELIRFNLKYQGTNLVNTCAGLWHSLQWGSLSTGTACLGADQQYVKVDTKPMGSSSYLPLKSGEFLSG